MKACINCHQKKEQLSEKGLCEDCHDAFYPNVDFVAAYDYNAGKTQKSRMVLQ